MVRTPEPNVPATLKILMSVVLLAALAACSDAGATARADAELRRDLDAAKIELRPTGSGTDVVGAMEQVPQAASAPSAPRKREVARRTPRQARRPEPAPVPQVASAPEPVEAEEVTFEPVPAARRPVQPATPAISPPPPGGYKSVNEVMRSAPFPINP
jgi:hypothetical protein